MTGPFRVAAIDCGTNSIRLLVAEPVAGSSALVDVHRDMQAVRLGEGVDRTGRLSEQAIERTRLALRDYAAVIRSAGASRVRMVATSASRDASNSADFTSMVERTLGVTPEVITGLAEAELSFVGAAAALQVPAEPVLVVDIGGGSTELVLGLVGGEGTVLAAHSMDVGCVRMTERHLATDPPRPAEIEATLRDLRAALDRASQDVPLTEAGCLVGVAGTVTTIAALALQLPAYDADAIHGTAVSYQQVSKIADELLAMTRAQRAALAVMHPGRVDVIGGGALVLRTVMEYAEADEVIASEHDILDGIALSIASRS